MFVLRAWRAAPWFTTILLRFDRRRRQLVLLTSDVEVVMVHPLPPPPRRTSHQHKKMVKDTRLRYNSVEPQFPEREKENRNSLLRQLYVLELVPFLANAHFARFLEPFCR